ncbi:glutamine synthetase/guanido kinase [Daedalea quercina L-15889]|uniref:Glutamine synthetase/guanido kinase n=1 Tax=Daedalea quercina L-15889 TaxID=1314783 RepID=A0A165LF41_9APHY|nr:glutamine synthetase/guanido kinase [Daedalea quercina L-15889]
MSQIGIVYTPEQGSPCPQHASVDTLRLAERGVRYVRVQWLDLVNTVRFRILPASYFARLCRTARPGVCLSRVTLGLVGLQIAAGFSGTGEDLLAFDLDSFRLCPYAPGHAVVMGWFQEKVPAPGAPLASPLCPRALLQRVVDAARAEAGLAFLAGFESEFILLSATAPRPVAVNDAHWTTSAKFRTGTVENTVMEEIADGLQEAGIELQMVHAEAAPGQFEVVTGPLAPLEAADALVFTRETIYNVATKHGLRATFAPRLHADNCGSGAHVHFSVHSSRPAPAGARRDAALAPTLTATERSFLQGVLEHLPALCALLMPTPASYARMQDGIWAGGTYSCWGTDNKDAPLRLCGTPGAHHFELKPSDGTASPHLVLAGVLAAGLGAVLRGAELQSGDCTKPAAWMSEDERRAVGLGDPLRLPRTVGDARRLFQEDAYLREKLGDEFVTKYAAVNKELETYMQMPTEEETVTRLVEYY